jgi:hypothetical protein
VTFTNERSSFGCRVIIAAAIVLLSAFTPRSATAQAPVGSIEGVVTDSTGAVVPGATVTATSLATRATRSATSDARGAFVIATLKPGDYSLKVSSTGFVDFIAPNISVQVGQTTRVEAALSVQALNENVSVTAASVAVDTSQTAISGVVNLRQINELPLNGRNYLELAKLQPGVEI